MSALIVSLFIKRIKDNVFLTLIQNSSWIIVKEEIKKKELPSLSEIAQIMLRFLTV
jgi:hypothetical protein